MRLTIFLISNLIVLSVCGQRTYYFNNKNLIGYTNNLAYTGIDIKRSQHHLTYKRLMSRKKMFIVDYTYSRTPLKFVGNPQLTLGIADPSSSNITYQAISPTGTAFFRTRGLGIGLRNFIKSKGAIAPFGTFIDMRMGYTHIYHKKNDDNLSYFYSRELKDEIPTIGIDHLNMLNFQFGLGSSKQIAKNIYFDWMLGLNLNIPLWRGETGTSLVYAKDLYYYRAAKKVYTINNIGTFNIGIHYGF